MTAIEIRNLLLNRTSGFTLGPLSLTVRAGSRTALLGPSGCGKTTLLRCLAGLESPNGGTILFGDQVVQREREQSPPSSRGIGFVFQDAALWPHLSAAQHLRFVDPRLTRSAAIALLEQVGIAKLADRRPGALSGGEGKRLALARALAGDPKILLLDEPLHSIDVSLRDELSLLIRSLCERHGLTLVVVTHDRDEALAMADDLVVLRDGAVVETGTVHDILRNPSTAFGAALLCGAACLPTEDGHDGSLRTAFGPLPRPERPDAVRLVLLPGDVIVPTGVPDSESASADGHPYGRVLQVVPTAAGNLATVALDGHTLHVPVEPGTLPGQWLPLALRGAPRFLPEGEA